MEVQGQVTPNSRIISQGNHFLPKLTAAKEGLHKDVIFERAKWKKAKNTYI